MVTPSGQAKILDFGLAKLLDSEAPGPAGFITPILLKSAFPTARRPMPRLSRLAANAWMRAPIFFQPAFCSTKC